MKNILYSVIVVTALLLTGCANAGKDQKVVSGDTVMLDGNASTASIHGELQKYKWRQVRGVKVVLSDNKSVQPTFIAPNVLKKTRLVFRLKTTEIGGYFSPFRTQDNITVTVEPASNENQAPDAVVSVSSNTIEVGENITFDASPSSDSDGRIISYQWKDEYGTELSTESTFTHTFTDVGSHTITLTVTDNNEAVGNTSVTIEVTEVADTIKPVITLNGESNMTLMVGGTYTELGATANDNKDGNITGNIVIGGETVDITTAGTYTVTYDVNDSAGNSAETVRRVINILETKYGREGEHFSTHRDEAEHNKTSIYYPTDLAAGEKVPVVFFNPGWNAKDKPYRSTQYKSLLTFIASHGYYVIYLGQSSLGNSGLLNYEEMLEENIEHIDTTRIGVVGHSLGGGNTFKILDYFSKEKGYGENGRFIMALEPWYAFKMDRSTMKNLPVNTNVVIQQYGVGGNNKANDTDARIPLTEYYLLDSIDDKQKDYQIYEDVNHTYPYGDGNYSNLQVILKPLDALMEYTFKGTQNAKNIALEVGNDDPYANGGGIQMVKPISEYHYKCNDTITFDIDYCSIEENSTLLSRKVDSNLTNLLIGTNPQFDTLNHYKTKNKHAYISNDSHTNDGSGSAELIAHHWGNALYSETFPVKKGKKYLLSAYIKMTKVPHGQNVNFAIWPREVTGWSQVGWNVSKANEWQEVLLPFTPVADGDAKWGVFTSTRAYSTDYYQLLKDGKHGGVARYLPKAVDINGTNLDRSVRVFLDDFKVIEVKEELTPREMININKKGFESEYLRVDTLGNYSIKKNGIWQPIIPKLISRSNPRDVEHFIAQLEAYKAHGFNGVMGMYDVGQIKKALGAGLEYLVGMGASSNTQPDGTEGEYSSIVTGEADRFKESIAYLKSIDKPYALLYHYLDNENAKTQEYTFKEKWANFIDINDQDSHGNRARPIFYLNGTFGISRLYRKNLMDITGAYVGLGGTGSPYPGPPKPTIGVMDVTQEHDVPSNVIQLQVYLRDKFIPSLWFGIIQGGKVISVWSDGEGDGVKPENPKPFQEYVWASDIKKVFSEVDSMADIIREAHWTQWKAHFEGSEYVNLGTREHNGDKYIILSNHSDNDENITIHFEGVTPISVKDYLGNSGTKNVLNNQVSVTIGHGNQGYLILKLQE